MDDALPWEQQRQQLELEKLRIEREINQVEKRKVDLELAIKSVELDIAQMRRERARKLVRNKQVELYSSLAIVLFICGTVGVYFGYFVP